MLAKALVVVACVCLVQASFVEEHQNGVSRASDALLSRPRRSCGAGECNAHCIKLGHKRGVCIGTYCQCRSRLRRSPEEEDSEKKTEHEIKINENLPIVAHEEYQEIESVVSPAVEAKSRSTRATCSYDGCNSFCRKLGHARGVCIGSYCQCRFQRRRRSVPEEPSSGVTNAVETVLSRSRRSCGAGECNAHCIKLGYKRGVCIGTYCQCRSR